MADENDIVERLEVVANQANVKTGAYFAMMDAKKEILSLRAQLSEARGALPLRPFEPANYIQSPEDLDAYREAAIEGEVAQIVAWLRNVMYEDGLADAIAAGQHKEGSHD